MGGGLENQRKKYCIFLKTMLLFIHRKRFI